MTDSLADLAAFLDRAWALLVAGARDTAAFAHRPALATIGADGGPEARVMVLRGVDRAAGTLDLHTDAASAKLAQIRADPRATILVWDPEAGLQIRARARIDLLGPAETARIWQTIPRGGRLNYGGTPAPGQPLDAPREHARTADPARLAVLRARIDALDLVDLASDPHRRALFLRAGGVADTGLTGIGFTGTWRAP